MQATPAYSLKYIWNAFKNSLIFFSVLLRAIMILAPGFIFLVLAWMCFWQLSQGKDVLIDMLEKKFMGGFVLLAILFWSVATWYSSRIIVYRKESLFRQNKLIAFHLPRFMGYISFSIIWIALLSLPPDAPVKFTLSPAFQWGALIFSFGIYIVLNTQFGKIRDKLIIRPIITESDLDPTADMAKAEKKRFLIAFTFVACLSAGVIMLNFIWNAPWLKIISIIALQIGFLFAVVIRRGQVPTRTESRERLPAKITNEKTLKITELHREHEIKITFWEKFLFNNKVPIRERFFFRAYNILSLLSVVTYFVLIFYYPFSAAMGAFATVLIGFGVLVGFFSMISFLSIVSKINYHLVIVILIFAVGKIVEPHWATIIQTGLKDKRVYDQRPDLYTYFENWVKLRQAEIEKDSIYPMYFVLSDGGASRSGYWSSSVLSKLEDTTAGKFSRHLFCLSGASGGSVGNGTFLALLKYREALRQNRQTYLQGTQEFLKSDFLTYTIARMLGPDMFKPMIPIKSVNDRAAALEDAMETAEKSLLQNKFSLSFSAFFPEQSDSMQLPLIGINTTRMQDGRPAIITSIKPDAATFGERRDVLRELKPGEDMKLSTAVVMGARFPYLSPAGRIGDDYYVDGGYFDNSGAGFVNEMMIGLKKYIEAQKAGRPWLAKLRFYVIHAQNGYSSSTVEPVHPAINDLAAPIITLFGTYGTQTSVNDWRMLKYMEGINPGIPNGGYFKVNLYNRPVGDTSRNPQFPMNWVISNYYLEKMDRRLYNQDMMNLVGWIKNDLKL